MALRPRVVLTLTLYDLKRSYRRPLTLFWEALFPIFMITLTVYVFIPTGGGTPAKTVRVLVVPEGEGLLDHCRELAKYMNNVTVGEHRLFNATAVSVELDEAIEMLRNGTCDAVVVVPRDYPEMLERFKIHVKVYRLAGTLDQMSEQFTAYAVRSFFDASGRYVAGGCLVYLAQKLRRAGIAVSGDPLVAYVLERAEEVAFNNTVIEEHEVTPRKTMSPEEVRRYAAGIMAMAMAFVEYLFTGILGAGSAIVEKFERRYMERLLSTRLSPWELFASLTLGLLVEGASVTVLCLAFAAYALRAIYVIGPLSVEALFIAALALVAMLLTTSVGVMIGTVFRSTEAVNAVANLIIWPTMFLGGIWLPKWMIPEAVRWFADINPLSHMLQAIIGVMTYGRPVTEYLPTLAASLALSAVLMSLSALLYRRYVASFLER